MINLNDYKSVNGIGNYAKKETCVMSLAALLDASSKGIDIKRATDQFECADPVLRRLLICRNDGKWNSQQKRDVWMRKMAPRVLNTRNDERNKIRAEICVKWAIEQVIAHTKPPQAWLEWANGWLSGKDRSSGAAEAAAYAEATYTEAAYAAYAEAAYAAYSAAAAKAAYAATCATYAATAAYATYAEAAAYATYAEAAAHLDELIELILDDCKKHPAK